MNRETPTVQSDRGLSQTAARMLAGALNLPTLVAWRSAASWDNSRSGAKAGSWLVQEYRGGMTYRAMFARLFSRSANGSGTSAGDSGGQGSGIARVERFVGPDVLRFVAASLVIARHWTITLEDNHTFIAILWPIAGGGLLGVDMLVPRPL